MATGLLNKVFLRNPDRNHLTQDKNDLFGVSACPSPVSLNQACLAPKLAVWLSPVLGSGASFLTMF